GRLVLLLAAVHAAVPRGGAHARLEDALLPAQLAELLVALPLLAVTRVDLTLAPFEEARAQLQRLAARVLAVAHDRLPRLGRALRAAARRLRGPPRGHSRHRRLAPLLGERGRRRGHRRR